MKVPRPKRWVVAATVLLCLFVMGFENYLTSSKRTASSSFTSESAKPLAVLANLIVPQKTIRMELPHHPLRSEADLDILLREIGDARVVLLGEASHGTAEYYTWRAAITKRLIQEKGFDFIAVEGEWADSYRVNNFIKGPQQDNAAAVQLLRHYNRWPTWMWGNYEVAELVTWLNNYNQQPAGGQKAGFFGLDVYCLWEALEDIMPYLEGTNKDVLQAAQQAHRCFQPYTDDAQAYAMAVARASDNCRTETNRLWRHMQELTNNGVPQSEELFVAQQHALVALNGERYYRAMVSDNSDSWNIRDRHMAQTLDRLLQLHGSGSKAIIWEHNTHVGDARYTDMAQRGEVNVGQLARKAYGEQNVFIVGFGSYQGSVIAASRWGAPIKKMPVPAAQEGSWEQLLHADGGTDKLLFSKDLRDNKRLKRSIGHRAIGVVYNPSLERFGNYVPSIMPQRYDAFMYFDQTEALHPLDTPVKGNEPPDLYPFGT